MRINSASGGRFAGVCVVTPSDPDFEQRVRNSFARQDFMTTLGAELARLEPGIVDIVMARSPGLLQQHGFVHAGATMTIMDSAAGYAAFSLFAAGHGVLTTECKVNLLRPADGVQIRAEGRVIKPGKTLTVCRTDAYAVDENGGERHISTGLFTMMQVAGLND